MQQDCTPEIITMELDWLESIVEFRTSQPENSPLPPRFSECPYLDKDIYPCRYQALIDEYKPDIAGRVLLLTALASLSKPDLLLKIINPENANKIPPSQAGLRTLQGTSLVMPTVRTVFFLLGISVLEGLMKIKQDHWLFKNNIVRFNSSTDEVSWIDQSISVSEEFVSTISEGVYEPVFSGQFPARKAETTLAWADLVLRDDTRIQIEEIKGWMIHKDAILQNQFLSKYLKKGYRALFYGPSGTGKTLTATLLGQAFGMPVYVVDLSTIISKYIGETEKNLEKIFTMAENKGWVLFFDEAEALFGKRTATSSSNDRYANQEVSYLLQRIENYNGIVILASNKLFDIDEAFTRRFQTFVEFPAPNEEERLKLWENTFLKTGFTIAEDINFKELAMSKEVTGGMLINVLRYCAIRIMERGDNTLCQEDLVLGLKKEYRKERKMWVDTPQKSLPKKVLLTSLSKSTEGENIKPGTTVLHNGLE